MEYRLAIERIKFFFLRVCHMQIKKDSRLTVHMLDKQTFGLQDIVVLEYFSQICKIKFLTYKWLPLT